MWISPAYAQAAGGGDAGGIMTFLPLILIFVVFYFLLIRPQQKKVKQHREMVAGVKRGDEVVTGGGLVGKVTKVDDESFCTVEIAPEIRVKVVKSTLTDILNRTEPAASAPANDAGEGGERKSLLGGLLGKK